MLQKTTLFAAITPLLITAGASAQQTATLLFDSTQYRLGREEVQTLESFWSQLPVHRREELRFQVEGRADPMGSAGANRKLAARRAQSVNDWLNQQGIADTAISRSSRIERDGGSECPARLPRTDKIACLAPARQVTITVAPLPRAQKQQQVRQQARESGKPIAADKPPAVEYTGETKGREQGFAKTFAENAYLALDLYRVTGDQKRGDFANAMAADGVDVSISDYDVRRFGYQLSLGYRYHPAMAVELGYLDLGEVDFAFDAETADTATLANALADHLPIGPDGWTLANRFNYTFGQWRASASVGLYFWDSESSIGDPTINPGTREGTDPLIGLGVAYPLSERVEAGLQYRRVFLDDQDVDLWGARLSWFF